MNEPMLNDRTSALSLLKTRRSGRPREMVGPGPSEDELRQIALETGMSEEDHSLGYVGGWLTGWEAYSPQVNSAFARPGERLAGFIYIGSPGRELEERPRPDPAQIVLQWDPPAD